MNAAAARRNSTIERFDLERFVAAQAPVSARVLEELRAGRKRSHWMWFVFPQMRGLGQSPMAQRYGIVSLDEARAYLAHPLLGPRLRECTALVIDAPGIALSEVLEPPDDLKFCSSMTLFDAASDGADSIFRRALERWCGGREDPRTLALI